MSNKKLKTNIFQIVFHRDDQFVERPRVFSPNQVIDLHVVTSPEN